MKDVTLDDKALKVLRNSGVLGFSLEGEFPYAPKKCRIKKKKEYIIPKKFWPVFTLQPLNGVQLAHIEDLTRGNIAFEDEKAFIKTDSGKARLKILQMGIVTWKNYRDDKGALIDPPTKDSLHGGITEDSLEKIPTSLQVELSNAITENDKLTKEELLGLEL